MTETAVIGDFDTNLLLKIIDMQLEFTDFNPIISNNYDGKTFHFYYSVFDNNNKEITESYIYVSVTGSLLSEWSSHLSNNPTDEDLGKFILKIIKKEIISFVDIDQVLKEEPIVFDYGTKNKPKLDFDDKEIDQIVGHKINLVDKNSQEV